MNHDFLSLCLSKASLNTNIIGFFNSYHSNCSTTYSWNNFLSLFFNTNIGIDQDSALSPILSTIYLVPIIKTFKKKIKNLKIKILTDILSFVDNNLLISQEKSYSLSFFFLLCSYNIMSKLLLDADLIMEHNKTKLFHFTQAQNLPNLSINLSSIDSPIISSKSIWQYLGFYFDWKLNFNYHTYFYTTKCMSTLNAMKILENSSRDLSPIQKKLLYRTCVLPIALYGFQLWFFKGAPTLKNINELKKCKDRLPSRLLVHSICYPLKPLLVSFPSPCTFGNWIADIIYDTHPFPPSMLLTHYLILNTLRINFYTK